MNYRNPHNSIWNGFSIFHKSFAYIQLGYTPIMSVIVKKIELILFGDAMPHSLTLCRFFSL
jgi:hypothetical protein